MPKENLLIIPSIDWLGGPENRLHRIVPYLYNNLDVSVYYFMFNQPKRRFFNIKLIHSHNVLISDNKFLYYLSNLLIQQAQLFYIILKNRYKYIILANPLYGVSVLLVSQFSKSIVLFDMQDNLVEIAASYVNNLFLFKLVRALMMWLVNLSVKYSDVITVVSSVLLNFTNSINKNVIKIPNGVDVSLFKKNKKKRSIFTIGYVGALTNWSGIENFINITIPILVSSGEIFQIIIYGSGPLSEVVYKKSKNYRQLKFKGEIEYSKVPVVMSEFDVGIIPFEINLLTNSSCPIKLFEYWASETAVISMPLYEVKKIGSGAVLFSDNFINMAQKIIEIKNNISLKNDLIKSGLKKVNNYDWSLISNIFYKLLIDIKKREIYS